MRLTKFLVLSLIVAAVACTSEVSQKESNLPITEQGDSLEAPSIKEMQDAMSPKLAYSPDSVLNFSHSYHVVTLNLDCKACHSDELKKSKEARAQCNSCHVIDE